MSNYNYNAKYKEEVARFTKKDGLIAMCYFAYVLVMSFAYSFFALHSQIAQQLSVGVHAIINDFIMPILYATPVFVIIFLKKQGLSSIGFHKKNLGSVLLLCLAILIFTQMLYSGALLGLIQGGQLHTFSVVIELLIIVLIAAAWEDIVFSGFIQPRLHGIIKNNIVAVFIGALFFAFVHMPVFFVATGLSPLDALLSDSFVVWIILHILLNLVFRKYFSIFPVIMLHASINLASRGGEMWESGVTSLDTLAPFPISFIIMTVAVILWAIYQSRKSRKNRYELD